MATTLQVVLPGDKISPASLPKSTGKKALTLGPGLQHTPPDAISTTIAGALVTDARKNAAWVEYNSGRVSYLTLFFLLLTLNYFHHHPSSPYIEP